MNALSAQANRMLAGLAVLGLLAAVAAPVSGWFASQPPATPLSIPRISIDELPASPPPHFPERNPFDLEGRSWRPVEPNAATANNSAAVAQRVGGIVKLPGLEGVVTDGSFVKIGQDWQGENLKSVTSDGYVLSGPSGDQSVAVNPDRDKRVKGLLTTSQQGKPRRWFDK